MNTFEAGSEREIFLDLRSERAEDKKFEMTIREIQRSREEGREVGEKQLGTCEEKVAAEIAQASVTYG